MKTVFDPPATWYRVQRWGKDFVVPVQVLSETDQYVTVAPDSFNRQPHRAAKKDEYFPTFQEAKKYMLDYLSGRIESANHEADYNKVKRNKVALLEDPCVPR